MDFITAAYSHLCGQEHCLLVDGVSLPVCQRCLGLYVGAAVTCGAWIAAGLWRRGLPTGRVVGLHAVLLATAMLGGLHVLDGGVTWRLLCGLWTGHVVFLWLAGSARHLVPAFGAGGSPESRWTPRDELWAIGLCALLTILAATLQVWLWVGWWPVSAVVIAGTAGLAVAAGAAVAAVAVWAGTTVRADEPTPEKRIPAVRSGGGSSRLLR